VVFTATRRRGGLPSSQTRAISGFVASTTTCKEVVLRLANEMFPNAICLNVTGRLEAISLVNKELALALLASKKNPSTKEAYGVARDQFKAAMEDNNVTRNLQSMIAGIFDLVTREFIIDTLSVTNDTSKKAVEKAALKVSSFVSASALASYQALLANPNFAGNNLSHEQFCVAFLKHVGLDPPLHEICLACNESYSDKGALHHSTSCLRIRPATMGKCVKDALVLGLKAAFGVSIPRTEPILGNLPGISRKVDHPKAGKRAKVKDRADFAFSSCGTTFVVDSTSGVALPYGVTAETSRVVGLHAAFVEAKKRLEYKEWVFGAPNEFVPFALDNTGMLSMTSLRFIHRMKSHAKRLDRFRGLKRFYEALSIGLVKGSTHGFALMARGDGVRR
jgi:hypothetical protein